MIIYKQFLGSYRSSGGKHNRMIFKVKVKVERHTFRASGPGRA
jgi:hypothetical protein